MDVDQLGSLQSMADETEKISKVLTHAGRKRIATKNFALPGGRYPIHDSAHARNALARVAQHGTPSEQARVRAAVEKKYPSIKTAEINQAQGAAIGGVGLGGLSLLALPKLMKQRNALLRGSHRLETLYSFVPGARYVGPSAAKLKLDADAVTNIAQQVPLTAGGVGSLLGAAMGSSGSEKRGSSMKKTASLKKSLEKKAFIGALSGALSADKGRRWEGAGKGFVGGDLVGGTLGSVAGGAAGIPLALLVASTGAGAPIAPLIPTLTAPLGAVGGAALGGYLSGRTARSKKGGKEKKAFLQGDPQAMQVAQQRMIEIWVRLMILYMLYWDGHWKSAGPTQNADHALFAKLYGDTTGPIDQISEKIHGYFGNEGFSLPQAMAMVMQGLQELYSSGEDHVHMGLLAEDYFQAHLRQTHQELTQLGVLPLGLDDWLMATASDFETHGYLLQQRASAVRSLQKVKTAGLWQSLFGSPARAATASETSTQLLKNMNLPKRSPEDTLKLMKERNRLGLPFRDNRSAGNR